MIHLISALVLTVAALGGAGYAIYLYRRAPGSPNVVPAVVLLLAAIAALIAPEPVHFFYKGAVGLALLLLFVGSLLMLVPGTPRAVAHGTHALVHFLLWLGFAVTAGRLFWTLPALFGLLPLLAAAGYALLLRPGMKQKRLGELWPTVLVYAMHAGLALATATVLLAVKPGLWSGLALAGTLLLVADDALRAWDAFKARLTAAALWATAASLAGALMLAWSVWGPEGLRLFGRLFGG